LTEADPQTYNPAMPEGDAGKLPFLTEAPPHLRECIFSEKDNEGHTVCFDSNTWQRLLNNPFYPSKKMRGKESLIKQAVVSPDLVREDFSQTPDGKNVIKHRLYFKKLADKDKEELGHNGIKVVVRVINVAEKIGKVTNAIPMTFFFEEIKK